MAYLVNKSNGDQIQVDDGTINTQTSLYLIGKNFAGYGEYIAEDLVYLLENFANDIAPANPTTGQIWYDTTIESFKSWNGSEWTSLALDTISTLVIEDTSNVGHKVTALMDDGDILGVISSESFDVLATDPMYTHMTSVGNGITLVAGAMLHGTATTALYADLAENYKGDDRYEPGTVMKLGGTEEVTQTTSPYCDKVFGITSTDPAYLMNSGLSGTPIALEGRVPCKVVGKVQKGDRLVASDIPGVAMVGDADKVTWMNQVGRALEDKETDEVELIEVVVGAK